MFPVVSPLRAVLNYCSITVNTKVVREATSGSPRAGGALARDQEVFLARRNAAFGRADYDLHKAMRERLDHLLAVERY